MVNIFGPGHYGTTNETASRPTPIATSKAFDAWFQQCNPDGTGGTVVDEMFMNFLVATLRQAVRTGGAAEGELIETMLAEAKARYASGGVWYVDTGTANAHAIASPLLFITPKSYFQGMRITYAAAVANTGNVTVNVTSAGNALGAKPLLMPNGAQITSGTIPAGGIIAAWYDPAANAGAGAFRLFPWSLLQLINGALGVRNSGTTALTHNTYVRIALAQSLASGVNSPFVSLTDSNRVLKIKTGGYLVSGGLSVLIDHGAAGAGDLVVRGFLARLKKNGAVTEVTVNSYTPSRINQTGVITDAKALPPQYISALDTDSFEFEVAGYCDPSSTIVTLNTSFTSLNFVRVS